MILSLITTALAQTGRIPREGIVPECDPGIPAGMEGACDLDALINLGENIVNTLIAIGFMITVLFVVIGAFRIIVSQGSPERITQARANISSAIIGLIIVLVSWVVLNTAINFFVDKERCERDWWRFQGLQCEPTQQLNPTGEEA